MNIAENLNKIKQEIPSSVCLIAVSKTKSAEAILEVYKNGHKIFGENKVQEMTEKHQILPKDIQWHLIGHLQSNKVKYIAPFVSLIHSVDSLKLLQEINKEAIKSHRTISCLLQIHIAKEETKFGFSKAEVIDLIECSEFEKLKNIKIEGLMGMATFTDKTTIIRNEFGELKKLFDLLKTKYINHTNIEFKTLSMGMSGDYALAIEMGSNMIRVGSAIFGGRN